MDEERLMILRLLEDGKVTAEEAAELLQALEASVQVGSTPPPPGPGEAPAGDQAAAAGAGGRVPLFDGIERLLESLSGVFGETHRFETMVEGTFAPDARQARVVLNTFNGRIEVHGWDRPGYRLELVKQVRARSEEAAQRLAGAMGRVTRGEQFVAVETDHGASGGMRITCWLPQDLAYELDARSSNGRILVEDLTTERMRLSTSNGRVEVARGRCRDAEIDTSNGRIVVAGPVERLTARTSNGRIEVTPPEGMRAGSCDLHTSNGSVVVGLAAGVPVKLDLSTHLGRIDLSLDQIFYEVNEKGTHSRVIGATPDYASGTGVDLRVRTSNGSIRVGAARAAG